jgi:crossover junction endodeoxyribonuclease RusA
MSVNVVRLTLPLPPSVNSYWRSVPATRNRRARVLISEEGRRFKARCRLAAQVQCKAPMAGEIEVRAVVYFRDNRRDLDNVFKPLLDALQGVAYTNDRQVHRLDFSKRIDRGNPRIEMEIAPFSEAA